MRKSWRASLQVKATFNMHGICEMEGKEWHISRPASVEATCALRTALGPEVTPHFHHKPVSFAL